MRGDDFSHAVAELNKVFPFEVESFVEEWRLRLAEGGTPEAEAIRDQVEKDGWKNDPLILKLSGLAKPEIWNDLMRTIDGMTDQTKKERWILHLRSVSGQITNEAAQSGELWEQSKKLLTSLGVGIKMV